MGNFSEKKWKNYLLKDVKMTKKRRIMVLYPKGLFLKEVQEYLKE